MLKILFSAIFLLALCKQSSGINQENIPQPFLTTDDEKNTSSPKNLKLKVYNHDNLYYFTNLSLGVNTAMQVLLETRTNNLWLPGLHFYDAPKRRQYNCSASPTCDETNTSQQFTYALKEILGYNNTFTGNTGHEIIGLTQDFQVKSSILWANQISLYPIDQRRGLYFEKVDGFMGLGSNESSNCYIDQAYEQNYIQEKVFSFSMDSVPPHNFDGPSSRSYLSIGYIPEDKVNKLTWLPIDSASPNSWTMSFSSVKIGDKVLNTSSDPFANKISVDSGAPYITLPPSVFKDFNAQLQDTPSRTGFYRDEVYMPCNDNYTDSYPKITFKFDNMDIVIDPDTYLSFQDVLYYDNNTRFCRVLAVSSKTAMPILGSPFLRNYFVAFSKRNQTVGIHPEVKQIRFGNIKEPSKITWVHISGVVGLLLVIIVACILKRNQKKTEDLKQLLNNDDDEQNRSSVFYSQAGLKK